MTNDLPLMPKATAVWLVDNTTLTFRQIAEFCGMHELEVAGIADGEVAVGIKGFDPVQNNQLTAAEIKRCEEDPVGRLSLVKRSVAPPPKKKAPRYMPTSKRQDRPRAIAWIVRHHPEVENGVIAKLLGSTKPTIESIRNRTHWSIANLEPLDPVALGLCSQIDLDAAVAEGQAKKAKLHPPIPGSEKSGLMTTIESLAQADEPVKAPEPSAAFLEDPRAKEDEDDAPLGKDYDPDTFFNLPKSGQDD